MKPDVKQSLRSFAVECIVYGALVAAYFFLVLHFLGNWLNQLFHNDRTLYSFVALALIIGQGFFLELLTRALLALIKHKEER
jgi:membrane protease YdiL (CAAX protease family)